MYRFSMHVSDEDSELYWQTFKWPSRMHQNLEAARLRLSASRAAIVNSILADKEYVETHIQFFESQVESFSAMSDVDATASMVEGVLAMRKSIDKASAMAQSVQEREGQIGCPTSAFGSLSRIEASFQSYETLWQLASTVRESLARWIDEYFVDLDSELMVSYVRGWNTTLWTLARSFVAMQGPRHVVERLKATVDEFCRNTSVITSLRNPALRERHWDRIAGVIGLTFSDFAGLRLRQVLDLDLELVQDIIADISNEASVEYRLETGLEKMRLELTSSDFVLSQFFCSDFLLIENHRELASLLHDQLIRSESLFQLALGTSVHTRFEQWVKKLQRAQELAHAWAELQDGFVRLHPALVEQGSASLIGQETSDLFSGVSKTIALVSDIVSKNRKFIIVIHRTDLLDIVQGALNRLKTIARSVAPLVDAKRSVCPRLFLISDDEVLEFLAASTIDRLSAGIRKLFTGVHGLGKGLFQMQFSAALTNASKRATAAYDLKQLRHTHTSSTGSPEQAASRSARSVGKDAALTTHDPSEQPLEHISSLVSTHGELLAFESPVQMSAKTEVVICDIETRMREALRDEIVAAFDAARASTSLLEMLDAKCCMQALLVSSQAVIQAQMDEAAANCDEAQLRDLRGRITKTVDGIAALQRLSSPAALRARREAFAGLLISMLDSLATELKQPGSASRQMRLTYDCNRASELRVCLGSAVVSRQIAYGYEYCGSSAGLIVTPGLSQTFSNIVSMIVHGGFPLLIGQGGSGKTAAASELARLVGVVCVLIHCSGDMGMASWHRLVAGALRLQGWLVLRNANAAPQQVLLAACRQLSMLQRMLAHVGRAQTKTALLRGAEVALSTDSVVFATVESMSSARSMPAALRSLFRPCAVVAPEPTIIAEALLTARGFKFAKQLASRLDMFVRSLDACVGTRTRCGMSRLCHIIEHTTISNPSVGGQGEAEILARQLDEEFSPMLLLREEQSLSDLLKDIFGVVHFSMPVPRAEELGELQTHPITKPQIKLAADKLGLCATDYCIDKASVLIQCLQSGHSVVALVGRAMSGKSTCIALAKAALTAHAPNSAHLSIFEFAPNSVPVQRLVGSMSPDGWQDGAIDMLLRKGSAAARSARVEAGGAQSSAVRHSDDWKRKAGLAWLVFDGQIRSGWTDLLCEKLDWATSSARLGGGGAVCLRDVRLLLETSSLSCASPQTLTQTLVLFFEPRKLHSEHIAQSLLRRPPAVLEPLREFLMLVFRNMFMAAIQYAHPENTIRTLDAADERYKVEQIFRLLFALVDDIGSNGYGRLTDHEQLVWALASCLFSVIWVIGAQPTLAERTRFDSFVRGNLAASCARELERRLNLPDQALSVAVTLPAEGTVFDYQFDEKLLRWERWPGPRASIVPGLVSGLEDMVWTLDVTRVDRLARLYLRQKQHLLITGTDGVGKTLLGVNVCAKAAEEWADYDSQITTARLSSRLCPETLQRRLERGLEFKRRQTLGSSCARRRILLVDDLNVATVEANEASLECLRAALGSRAWLRGNDLCGVEDIAVVGLMTVAPGGAPLLMRYLRYFSSVCIDDSQEQRLTDILPGLTQQCRKVATLADFANLSKAFVRATVALCAKLRTSYPRTPKHPQFVFSMRDMKRILSVVGKRASLESELAPLVSLWTHAVQRVWCDRAPDQELESNLIRLAAEVVNSEFSHAGAAPIVCPSLPLFYLPSERASDGGIRHGQRLSSLELLMKHISNQKGWLDDRSITNACGPKGLELAQRVAFTIADLAQSVVIVGDDEGDRRAAVLLAARLATAHIIEHQPDGGKDAVLELTSWKEFLRDVFLSATRHELIAVYIDANSLSDQQREDVISMMNFGTVPDFVSSIATTEIKLAVYRVAQSRAERGSAVGSSGPENIADELEAWSNPAVFARFMRERIRVVLSVASQPRQLWQQQLADLATDVNVIHSRKWGKDTVRWHLRKHLSAGLIELEQTHENHVVAFLMDAASSAREIINHERQNTLSTIELRSDALMHSLDFFANEYTRRYVAQKDRLGKLSDTISTLHRRRDDLARSQADLQTWQRDLLKRTEAKRLEREEATYNLKTQRQTQSNVRDELKHLQDAYTSEVERTLPTLYTATKAVDALQRSDIYELKGLEEPHEGVLLVMEAVMLLLRWEARATETRWEAARRMISDPNFQRNIARFDKDLVSAATVHEIERCAHHAEFDSSVVSASSKAAACLRAWVKALDKYHKTLFLLEPKKRQMYEVEARLASQTSIVNDTSAAIAACDSALLDMKRAFETLVQERSKAYAKVKEVDNFLSAAAPLADSMAPLSSALQAEFDSEMKRHSRLLDESLLAACTLTYLGACTEITRVITKKRWISALTKASSSATATQPDLNVYQSFSFAQFMISDRLCDTFLVIEQAPDELMLETALIAKHHSRFALLWDPHGLGPAWIRSVERENKIATLSRLDCDFDYQLVLCMQKGVRVIASIDDGEAPAIIESLLRSHCIARPGPGDAFSVLVQRGVRSEPVTVMPGFRLYITVTRDYRQVGWRAWMAHVASVRVSSSLNGNAQLLETLILRTRNLELANLRRQAAVESANRQSRKELLLTRGIDYIRQLQASDLSGGDLHRTVVDIEQQLSIIQRAEARDLQTAERLASACKWYSEVGSALAAIFDVCRRMEQIRFEYLAPLGLYCSLLEDRCKTFECEGTPDMRTFVEDFVQHLCACLAPAYSYPHRVVFLFSLARVVAELEALGRDSACRFPDSQLRFLINGAADARDIVAKKWHPDEFPDNPSGEWLDPALWRAVTELSHLPEFARFAMEFARYANRATTPVMEASWEEVGIAADPLRAPFPSKWEQQLNKAERLLVLKALRPDSVFRGLECYARHVLGRLAVDAAFPADLFAQRHRLTSAYIPAVVIVDGLEDPLQHILHLAAKRNMANMVAVFSDDADLSDLTDSVIADLVVRGRWAIFIADTLLQTNLESALVRLRRVLAAQPNSNPNMRIWIIAAPSTTLPASLAWALKLWYEDYRDHRAYFNEAFGAAEDSIIPYEFKPTAMYRNVLFNLCGFYATIRTRTATPQLAPQTPLDFQLSHMADSIRLLRKCFTHCGGTPEASSLAQWLGSCVADTAYVSQAVNCWDSRLLSILFGESVGIAWNTADIETLSKLLAIKPVYDSMARNELEKCHTAIRALPRGSDFDLVLFGAGGSAACAANLAASRAIIAGLAKCWVEHHPAPPQTIWDGWAAIQTFFVRVKERLDLLMASSVFGILPKRLPKGVHRSLDSLFGAVPLPAAASALTGQGSGGGAAIGAAPVGKGPGKYMDHLLRTNMSMYRDILVTIQASLARVIAALNGSEPLSPLTELVVRQAAAGIVPSTWRAVPMYLSRLPLGAWVDDFVARLEFVDHWHAARHEEKVFGVRGLAVYDISKMFNPKALIQGK
nr:Dynein heavy chain 1, axonemal [Polyrhizophydium stewartii]